MRLEVVKGSRSERDAVRWQAASAAAGTWPSDKDLASWPDGRRFTREDDAELGRCVREALRQCKTPRVFHHGEHALLSYALAVALEEAGMDANMGEKHFSPAFLAGVAWAERRAREKADG